MSPHGGQEVREVARLGVDVVQPVVQVLKFGFGKGDGFFMDGGGVSVNLPDVLSAAANEDRGEDLSNVGLAVCWVGLAQRAFPPLSHS